MRASWFSAILCTLLLGTVGFSVLGGVLWLLSLSTWSLVLGYIAFIPFAIWFILWGSRALGRNLQANTEEDMYKDMEKRAWLDGRDDHIGS